MLRSMKRRGIKISKRRFETVPYLISNYFFKPPFARTATECRPYEEDFPFPYLPISDSHLARAVCPLGRVKTLPYNPAPRLPFSKFR